MKIIGFSLLLIAVSIFGLKAYQSILLVKNVEAPLNRVSQALDTNTANAELSKAIHYLEENQITEGSTSILWDTPSENVGLWFNRLKQVQSELENVKNANTSDKNITLIKIRGSLLNSEKKVIIPEGLSRFPHNTLWCFLTFFGIISGLLGIVFISNKNK